VRGIALGALIAWLIACGGRQVSGPTHLEKDNQITALWTQIRDFRRLAGMKLDPTKLDVIQYGDKPANQVAQVCPDDHDVPKTCSDICSLADAICDNAEAICGIADELGKDDDYAQDKCKSSKASCREAKVRCCGCSNDKPAVAP
jgi:hypothetical protein